jgi:AraC-like DNA-binding protein
LQDTFYEISGWHPDLMNENRLKTLQQEQINQALDDQRRTGRPVLYAFEKERALLANIRAGDRNAARRILNEMLAGIYLTSPQLVVLRARAVELLSYLTRAAIEDNPLLEPLIVRNHLWTERLVRAGNFEELSQFLTEALDGFIDAIYLHGTNRSNGKVHKALDFIAANFARKISLDEVAKEVSLSTSRLSHLIREMTGKTVLGTLLQIRIQHAQHLLGRTAKSCAEIAYETGFGDQSYFIKHFRRAMGVTPARYRRKR